MSDKKKKGGVPTWLRILFSVAIFGFLFYQVDFGQFWETILRANLGWAGVALAIIFVEQAVVALIWRGMLSTSGNWMPFTDTFRIILISDFWGVAFPTSMGSDIVKVVGLSKYLNNTAEAFSSLLVLRAVGFGLLFTIAAISATLFADRLPDEPVIEVITFALLAFCVAGVLGAIFAKRLFGMFEAVSTRVKESGFYNKLKEIHRSFIFYIKHPLAMSGAVGGGLFVQFCRIAYVYVLALSLGLDVEPVAFFVFVPIITALVMIPVSVFGMGVREGGYVALFSYVGLSVGESLGLSLFVFFINIVYVLFGGLIYWIYGFPGGEKFQGTKGMGL